MPFTFAILVMLSLYVEFSLLGAAIELGTPFLYKGISVVFCARACVSIKTVSTGNNFFIDVFLYGFNNYFFSAGHSNAFVR